MATRILRMPSILLVGNSVDEQEVYTRALHGSGYEVVRAATTVLAYRIATTTPTDMVITVAHCAGSMSGLELTRRLRLHTRTTAVPIIVLTRDTRRQDGDLSIKAGADISSRDLYRVMCCANMWYGCWSPPGVCRTSRQIISTSV